jgi:hypothetical protein
MKYLNKSENSMTKNWMMTLYLGMAWMRGTNSKLCGLKCLFIISNNWLCIIGTMPLMKLWEISLIFYVTYTLAIFVTGECFQKHCSNPVKE